MQNEEIQDVSSLLISCIFSGDEFAQTSPTLFKCLSQNPDLYLQDFLISVFDILNSQEYPPYSKFYSLLLLVKTSEILNRRFGMDLAKFQDMLSKLFQDAQYDISKPLKEKGRTFFNKKPSNEESIIGNNYLILLLEAISYWNREFSTSNKRDLLHNFSVIASSLSKKTQLPTSFYYVGKNHEITEDFHLKPAAAFLEQLETPQGDKAQEALETSEPFLHLLTCTFSDEDYNTHSHLVFEAVEKKSKQYNKTLLKSIIEILSKPQYPALSKFHTLYLLVQLVEKENKVFLFQFIDEPELLNIISSQAEEAGNVIQGNQEGTDSKDQDAVSKRNYNILVLETVKFWNSRYKSSDPSHPLYNFCQMNLALSKKLPLPKEYVFLTSSSKDSGGSGQVFLSIVQTCIISGTSFRDNYKKAIEALAKEEKSKIQGYLQEFFNLLSTPKVGPASKFYTLYLLANILEASHQLISNQLARSQDLLNKLFTDAQIDRKKTPDQRGSKLFSKSQTQEETIIAANYIQLLMEIFRFLGKTFGSIDEKDPNRIFKIMPDKLKELGLLGGNDYYIGRNLDVIEEGIMKKFEITPFGSLPKFEAAKKIELENVSKQLERKESPEKQEKLEKQEKNEKGEGEKPVKSERHEKLEELKKSEKPVEKIDKLEKGEEAKKPGKPVEKREIAEKPVKPERSEKPEDPEKSEKPVKPEKSEKLEESKKPEKPAKTEKIEKEKEDGVERSVGKLQKAKKILGESLEKNKQESSGIAFLFQEVSTAYKELNANIESVGNNGKNAAKYSTIVFEEGELVDRLEQEFISYKTGKIDYPELRQKVLPLLSDQNQVVKTEEKPTKSILKKKDDKGLASESQGNEIKNKADEAASKSQDVANEKKADTNTKENVADKKVAESTQKVGDKEGLKESSKEVPAPKKKDDKKMEPEEEKKEAGGDKSRVKFSLELESPLPNQKESKPLKNGVTTNGAEKKAEVKEKANGVTKGLGQSVVNGEARAGKSLGTRSLPANMFNNELNKLKESIMVSKAKTVSAPDGMDRSERKILAESMKMKSSFVEDKSAVQELQEEVVQKRKENEELIKENRMLRDNTMAMLKDLSEQEDTQTKQVEELARLVEIYQKKLETLQAQIDSTKEAQRAKEEALRAEKERREALEAEEKQKKEAMPTNVSKKAGLGKGVKVERPIVPGSKENMTNGKSKEEVNGKAVGGMLKDVMGVQSYRGNEARTKLPNYIAKTERGTASPVVTRNLKQERPSMNNKDMMGTPSSGVAERDSYYEKRDSENAGKAAERSSVESKANGVATGQTSNHTIKNVPNVDIRRLNANDLLNYKMACLKKDAVLYDNTELKVAVITLSSESKIQALRLNVYFANQSQSPMTDFVVNISSSAKNVTVSAEPETLEPVIQYGKQLKQQILFSFEQWPQQIPQLNISYKVNEKPTELNTLLPISIIKLMAFISTDPQAFSKRFEESKDRVKESKELPLDSSIIKSLEDFNKYFTQLVDLGSSQQGEQEVVKLGTIYKLGWQKSECLLRISLSKKNYVKFEVVEMEESEQYSNTVLYNLVFLFCH